MEACTRGGGFLIAAAILVAASASGEELKVRFLENGRQTFTVRPDQPATLLIVNPSSHRFRCTHLTQGLRVVATPAREVDVALLVQSPGRRSRPPIDRGGAGDAEHYDEHPPLGTTAIRIQVTSPGGQVSVVWTWDSTCHEKPKASAPILPARADKGARS